MRCRHVRTIARTEPLERRVLFAAGDLDPTFGGGDGWAHLFDGNSFDGGRAVLAGDGADGTWDVAGDVRVQRDGKVVLVGTRARFPFPTPSGSGPGVGEMAAVRFGADGRLDTGFGTGGIAVAAFDGSAGAVAGGIDAEGRLVLGGSVWPIEGQLRRTGTDFAIARMVI